MKQSNYVEFADYGAYLTLHSTLHMMCGNRLLNAEKFPSLVRLGKESTIAERAQQITELGAIMRSENRGNVL